MIKKNKEWVRQGNCKRCGICCKGDKITAGPLAENEYIQKFITIIGTDCPNLIYDSKNRAACGIYRKRYPECRVFPTKPEDLELVNADCGFYFVKTGPKTRKPR